MRNALFQPDVRCRNHSRCLSLEAAAAPLAQSHHATRPALEVAQAGDTQVVAVVFLSKAIRGAKP